MILDKIFNLFRKQPVIELIDGPVEIYNAEEEIKSLSLQDYLELMKPAFVPQQRKLKDQGLKRFAAYGIALGDIAGSRYEGTSIDGKDPETIDMYSKFNKFTDDTVLAVAVMKATEELKIKENITDIEAINTYEKYLKEYTLLYPSAGYGSGYIYWAFDPKFPSEPYNSCGNGAAMRSGIIGSMFDNVEDVIKYSYYSAMPTHNHPEGIKGAIFIAVCVWMVSFGASKEDIRTYFNKHYPESNGYKINCKTTIKDLKNMEDTWAALSTICQTSVPEAIINFLESTSFEDCIRNSMRYLCDRDTIAAISGGIAAIYYSPDIKVSGLCGSEMVKIYLDEKLLSDID